MVWFRGKLSKASTGITFGVDVYTRYVCILVAFPFPTPPRDTDGEKGTSEHAARECVVALR